MNKITLSALALVAMAGSLASCSKEQNEPQAVSNEVRGAGAAEVALPGTLETDRAALVDLYNALDGDHWANSSNWLSDRPVGDWAGVQVAQVNGQPRVVALYLGANKLSGKLPESLGQLSALRTLQLQYNAGLMGQIPESVYQLSQLRSLRLGFTALTGQLSASLGKLTNLDSLDLGTSPYELVSSWNGDMSTAKDHKANATKLTGELPASIGQLTHASYVNLAHQGFTGALPQSIGQLRALKYLSAYGCQFSGVLPSSLGQLGELTYLSLGDNQFSGAIPESLGDLPRVRELMISGNQLSGTIPASLGKLRTLQNLNLERNNLSGSIPESFSQLTDLYQIYLNDNKLTGHIPASFGGEQQPNLIWADFRNNDLTGSLPARVRRYTVGGQRYENIHGLPEFGYTIYAVSGNQLTGVVPQEYLDYPKTLKVLIPQRGAGFSNLSNK